jgi:hypothetical protein
VIWNCNPGGRAHQVLQARFISKAPPWTLFEIDGRLWCICFGTFKDNEHLPAGYEKDLFAACGRDRELFRAWRDGSWAIARGAFFGDLIDESKQMLGTDIGIRLPHRDAYSFVSIDWGISAPSVCYGAVHLLAPLGRYPRGSVILVDEVTSADRTDETWATGLQWSPGRLADHIGEMCKRHNIDRGGVIDDARGLSGDTLIGTMRTYGLHLERPVKGRNEGWGRMRELLFNSQQRNGRPGLWISQRCAMWWATIPTLPRDPHRPDDVDSASVDHAGDACRYAITHQPRITTFQVLNPAFAPVQPTHRF